MKTWAELKPEVREKPFLLDSECEEWIRTIQRDALLEAAVIADSDAVKVYGSQEYNMGVKAVRDAILERSREI